MKFNTKKRLSYSTLRLISAAIVFYCSFQYLHLAGRRNAFTPNKDGKNDCFGVQAWGAVTDLSFSIYNRWGQRIFYTTNPADCWDGLYKGKEQNPGVYIYQISAKGFCGDIYRKGTVILIR